MRELKYIHSHTPIYNKLIFVLCSATSKSDELLAQLPRSADAASSGAPKPSSPVRPPNPVNVGKGSETAREEEKARKAEAEAAAGATSKVTPFL